jgi:hypothetical protein
MATLTLREIPDAIASREAFKGNSMYAEVNPLYGSAGRLSGDERDRFNTDSTNGLSYVVYSYATPIAWVTKDGTVYKVTQKFSVTTSKHQGKLYTL